MDRDTIRDLMSLSKLDLDTGQTAQLQVQITRLLGYFDMLQSADTDDVEASPYPVTIPLRPRADTPEPPLPQEAVLQNAPARRAGSFLVPRVVEG